MAFIARRSDRDGPRRSFGNNDRRPKPSSSNGSGSSRPVSLSSRFSSLAAERLSSSGRSASSSRGVQKARNPRRRNDRGMEVDQVGSASSNDRRNNRNRNNRNRNNNNNGSKKNTRNPRAPGGNKKTPVNQSDLDKELEAYMMKNESTARNTLDMELDSYMSAAPSKTN